MLSRAFTKPTKRSPRREDYSKSVSILESEGCLVGFMDDLPLSFCGERSEGKEWQLSLRVVLRASVGVIGESRLGMTEKVVLLEGKVYGVKRFRKVSIGRGEFGRRVERLAQLSRKCEYVVPVNAYLFAKRIKFVLSEYFPMGSLSDLLAGARQYGHTALDWNQRLKIALCIARAISFIHTQCPPHGRNMQLNVHGNIKSSNVMIDVDFSARLSNYGFTQLAQVEELSDAWQRTPPPPPPVSNAYCDKLCQKSDVYNFGVILLDILGGARGAVSSRKSIVERKESIRGGDFEFFEFYVEGKERKQALLVLDMALACTNKLPDSRPSIEQVLRFLGDIMVNK